MSFPIHRPRRLRRSETLRRMVRETELLPSDLILPLFVTEGEGIRRPVPSMPGVFNLSVDEVVKEAREAHALGIPSLVLFGIPGHKDARGTQAWAEDGVVQRALRAIKDAVPELELVADICLCEYTDHGHCGVIEGGHHIANDATLPLIAKMAVSCARAGADIIAPSDMMDGRVGALRAALDGDGFSDTPIMSYAVKYASAFYGPFRDAAQSAPSFGDRRGYQMDPANVREGLKEVRLDLEEGADMVMVKPALSYLDVIHRVREEVDVPVAAYNVSGEYAMIHAAAERGWIDRERIILEVLTSIRRAGADLILTYHAPEAARLLNG
ncbi:MAG TPA: porphobilinogen synthase [Myxococcaceae bacterium]|nr:porphobilinogen synthase [Myxococcaceae bacterium]